MALIFVLSGIGLTFGLLLAITDRKLAVEQNPLIDEVDEELPKGQCGTCGFPGCRQYAESVVNLPDVPPDLCTPGGNEVARIVAKLTGKKAGEITTLKAMAFCRGHRGETCKVKHLYEGLDDCAAAAQLYAGDLACEHACLGFANCVPVCEDDAIRMDEFDIPVVDAERCTGCGKCALACPRDVMVLVPEHAPVTIRCHNTDKGGKVKKICSAGCLACFICVRTCPHDAIEIVDNLAVVDYEVCKECDEPVCLVAACKPASILPNHGYIVPNIVPPPLRPLKKKKKKPAAESSA